MISEKPEAAPVATDDDPLNHPAFTAAEEAFYLQFNAEKLRLGIPINVHPLMMSAEARGKFRALLDEWADKEMANPDDQYGFACGERSFFCKHVNGRGG